MRCYLDGYRDDRICDICLELNNDKHNKCKMYSEIRINSNLLKKCVHCESKTGWERGTNEYGYDEDYETTIYICNKTNEKCNITEECLDIFIKN